MAAVVRLMTLAAVPEVHILPAVFGNVPKLGVVIAEQSLTACMPLSSQSPVAVVPSEPMPSP